MSAPAHIELHFDDSGSWYSLPEWANYFLSIGKHLAIADKSNDRIVTAIVVPTRAYCAAFVSLGMVISDAATRDRSSEESHFENLFELPPGTPVIYRPTPEKTVKGIMQNPEVINGTLFVRVQVHSRAGGGLSHLIDVSHALQVQPAQHSGRLPKKQGGENSRFTNKFVENLLGDVDPVQLGLKSKMVCALVGKKNTLEHEILHTPLALHTNGVQLAKGRLQDVLRINQFISGEQSYRSALVAVKSTPPSANVISNVEKSVLFDGALGFIKWGQLWQGRHQVVILDRTEPFFADAVNAINSRFSQNRIDGEVPFPESNAPAGGEILAFREALK